MQRAKQVKRLLRPYIINFSVFSVTSVAISRFIYPA